MCEVNRLMHTKKSVGCVERSCYCTDAMQPYILYICKEQRPAACVVVMRVLVLSLMGVMLKGLAASAAKHAAQTPQPLPPSSLSV